MSNQCLIDECKIGIEKLRGFHITPWLILMNKRRSQWMLKRFDFSNLSKYKMQFHIFLFGNGVEFAFGYRKWIFYK